MLFHSNAFWWILGFALIILLAMLDDHFSKADHVNGANEIQKEIDLDIDMNFLDLKEGESK